MRMRHFRLFGAALLLSAAIAGATAKTPSGVKVGEVAPDFNMLLLDGTRVKLADLRGQVVVLNFWATWCAPCKVELPLLDAYYRVQKERGLRVFAVATEDSLPTRTLKPLFAAMAMQSARSINGPYPILGGLPTNYVIDRAGRVRYAKASAFDLDDLNTLLPPLLAEAPPT